MKNYLEGSSDSDSEKEEQEQGEDHGRRVRRRRFALCAALLLPDSRGRGPQVAILFAFFLFVLFVNEPSCVRDRNIKNEARRL